MASKIAVLLATALFTAGGMAGGAVAQAPARADAMTDPAFKREDVIRFMGLKPGDKVADIVAGRFARALSVAVGPNGKVYAVEPTEIVKFNPRIVDQMKAITADPAHANVEIRAEAPTAALGLPSGLDAVFLRQNYHDLYTRLMGPADIAGFNKQVYAALKPGGVYVIIDHAAAKGAPITVAETLHRIDAEQVKKDALAVGFKLDGESQVLANPEDDHTKGPFDPALRGKTDQFMLRFKKPK